MKLPLWIPVLMSASLMLSGCGGSGNTSGAAGTAEPDVSRGTITGFGSVFVNGTRFETRGARITADDTLLNDVRELEIGMVVTVVGDLTTSVASEVLFDEDIKGPLDTGVPDFSAPLSVLGQTVIVDASTRVDDSLVLPLLAGQILEVSGIRQSDDSLLATFVEAKLASEVTKYEVIGHARSVDSAAMVFQLGGLSVDYRLADVSDLPGGHPSEGQRVEVKDELLAYSPAALSLAATKIEPVGLLGDDASDSNDDDSPDDEDSSDSSENDSADNTGMVELETIIESVDPVTGSFTVPGLTVRTSTRTVFRFGTETDLVAGVVVQVRGVLNDAGELIANRITFKRNTVRLEAVVDTAGVDMPGRRLSVLGFTVQLTDSTELEDDREEAGAFSINDIADGDYLEIRGFQGADVSTLVATSLEREAHDSDASVRSVARNIDPVARTLELLGFTVSTGAGTRYEGADGSLMTAEDFFNVVTTGLSVVEASWRTGHDRSLPVDELSLEDDYSLDRAKLQ